MLAIAIYLGLVMVMSGFSLAAYGWDKRQAVGGGRRMPECTLHLLAYFGGWPGALLAQQCFRHKTKKTSFLIGFWFVLVIHLITVVTAAYVLFRGHL